MTDTFFLYSFLGLMILNLLASYVYLIGLSQLRMAVKRAFKDTPTQKPR